MEIENDNDVIVLNDNNNKLSISNKKDKVIIKIDGKNNKKIEGISFKITEDDRYLYKIFSDFFNLLKDEYNTYKEFHDFFYGNQRLFDAEHNWFTFYNDDNILRVIRNEKNDPYIIGIYIKQDKKMFVLDKQDSKYSEFIPCFKNLTNNLRILMKSDKAKLYTKKVGESNNG